MTNHRTLSLFIGVGRLHITAIGALGVFTFGWLFTGRYPWFLAGVGALDWYIVNLINRIVDLKEDRASRISGTEFVYQKKRLLMGTAIGLLIVSIVIIHLINPAITGLRIFCHVLGAFYNWPLLPGKRRLKQVYFWKNTASATGFLVTVFGYPLATARLAKDVQGFPDGITWETVLFSALFFVLFVLSYEVIYDLRDVKGDILAGIRTYPVVHGERVAVHLVDALIFSSMTALTAGYVLGVVPWRIFIMIGAPVLQFVVYKRALARGITAGDCVGITWMGAALFLIYHLWVVADLPGARL